MIAYSKLNPPTGFYVYMWLREDQSPYYVGKGMTRRAWRSGSPIDQTRIVIVEHMLTEEEAFSKERQLIKEYGRKDLGTGILRNMTDGGEGASGQVQTIDTIEKRHKTRKENGNWGNASLIGSKQAAEEISRKSERQRGQKHSPERNAKRSAALKGRKLSPEHIAKRTATVTGRKQRPEVIENRSAQLRGRKQEVITCPHCGKSGGCVVMKRHHFDHCKSIR